MDYQPLTTCIRILHQKPKWFFQNEKVEEKLQCLEYIQQNGTASLIHHLFDFLGDKNLLIKSKTAETIIKLFCRLKSFNDYSQTLNHLYIEEKQFERFRADFDEDTYIQLLAISSLNRNGYVREKAVRELVRLQRPEAIKFLLFRLGDWVDAIRSAAEKAVEFYLQPSYIEELVNQLNVIENLTEVKRISLVNIHTRIITFIIGQEFTPDIFKTIRKRNDHIRYIYFRYFLAQGSPTIEQIKEIVKDKHFLIRLEMLKHLSIFDESFQKDIIVQFLKDHSTRVRLTTLYASKSFTPEFNIQIDLLLSDEAISVRNLARSLLKEENMDFAAIYRQRVLQNKLLSGSLMGLSEVGSKEDMSVFEEHIQSSRSKVIKACLIGIKKYDSEKAKHYALHFLTHPINHIREISIEVLAKQIDNTTFDIIRKIYLKGNPDEKMTILKLYNKIGGWPIVADLILSLNEDDTRVQTLGWQSIQKWKDRATRLFTSPNQKDIQRANDCYNNSFVHHFELTPDREKLWQELKFYLK